LLDRLTIFKELKQRDSTSPNSIGVARGAVGAPAPPMAEKKIIGVIYRENL